MIERSLVMCLGRQSWTRPISSSKSAPRPRAQTDDNFLPEGMTLDEYEQEIIREALRRAAGNKSQAARLLGLTRNALATGSRRWGWRRKGVIAEASAHYLVNVIVNSGVV